MDLDKRRQFIVNITYWAIILALAFLVFKYLINLVMPFFLALVFASILRPFVRLLTKRLRFRHNIAAVLSVLLFFAILGCILVLCLAKLISGVPTLVSSMPKIYTTAIEPSLLKLLKNVQDLAARFDPAVVEYINNATPQIISSTGNAVTSFSMSAVSVLSGIATKIPGILLQCIICIIATVFMSVDYGRMTIFIMRQLPQNAKKLAFDIRDSLYKIVLRYGKSYVLILLITFMELSVGLLLIGVDKAILIALIIAFFDIFPIIGAGLFLVPWAVITLIQGNIVKGVSLALLYIIVVVIRQIIEPRIIGKHVGLHPIATLISMFVGASLFGAMGLIGVPITVAIIQNLNSSGAIRLFKNVESEDKEPVKKGKKVYSAGRDGLEPPSSAHENKGKNQEE